MSEAVKQAPKTGHFRNPDGSVKKKRVGGHILSVLGIAVALVYDPLIGICTAVAGQVTAWFDEITSFFKSNHKALNELKKIMKEAKLSNAQVQNWHKTSVDYLKTYVDVRKRIVAEACAKSNKEPDELDKADILAVEELFLKKGEGLTGHERQTYKIAQDILRVKESHTAAQAA